MKNLLVFVCIISISKGLSQSLEDDIYATTERFINSKNTQSLQDLDQAIAGFEPLLKTEDAYFAFINLIVNKAYYLNSINRQLQAIEAYEKAHQIYIKHKVLSYNIIDYCLIPLGVLYHKTNAYIKAENIIKHYIVLAETQGNIAQQVSGSINLALLYQSLNKHKSVFSIVQKALALKGINNTQKQRLKQIKLRSILFMRANSNEKTEDNTLIFNVENNT